MKKTKIFYYLFTTLFSLMILMGVYFELSGDQAAQDGIIHLGFPVYFNTIIGIAKLLAIIGIWQGFSHTLQEWAYAGLFFDLVGAVVCIVAIGDPFVTTSGAFVALLLWLISYVTFRRLKANSARGPITTIKA